MYQLIAVLEKNSGFIENIVIACRNSGSREFSFYLNAMINDIKE